MRLSALLVIFVTFLVAAGLSFVAAGFSVTLVEENSEIGVRTALDHENMPWAEVEADGLKVTLSGTAPSEAHRFKALSTAGGIVDAARVIDDMQVKAIADIAPPRFSIEILRNDSGVSVIGLVPAQLDRAALIKKYEKNSGAGSVIDLLETADYPVPEGWDRALAYSFVALQKLPRSKVSVDAQQVTITAISGSVEEKRKLERSLLSLAPPDLNVVMTITAPRPVITPFTLRFVLDDQGARFDACSAENDATASKILSAAVSAGMTGTGTCVVGMGVPTPRWGLAAQQAIAAVAELQGGSVTFSDADITLVALEGTEQSKFDNVVGELENALPDVFALHAVLPVTKTGNTQEPPEFIATLSPEGLVQLRGRVADENLRDVADSFARARFGSEKVHTAARVVPDLPPNWPVRILTGLEALAYLNNGAVTVSPDIVDIRGTTGIPDANASIAQLLADKLGTAEEFAINVVYEKKLDPLAGLPTPDECETEIRAIMSTRKITFEPSSANIDPTAFGTMDDIVEILKQCGGLRLEIQGHTDNQGREEMNAELSQARAQSVLDELRARRVLTSSFSAKGYGETMPIADNGTEAGREENRRIEFRLVRPEPSKPEEPTGLESTEDNVAAQKDETEQQEQLNEQN